MAKQFFTDDELVERLWDYENVKQLMAKHFYCYAGDLRRQELNDLWVKLPQNRRFASLGVNNGFYTGMEDISNYYVVQLNQLRYEQLKPFCDADPALSFDKFNLGRGILNNNAAYSPLLYIAARPPAICAMSRAPGPWAVPTAAPTADSCSAWSTPTC